MAALTDPSATPQMALQELIQRCAEETQRFFQQLHHDPKYCCRLFRLALVDGNRRAWEAIYAQFHPMVLAWVRTHPRFKDTGENADVFVNCAFMSLWQRLREPGRFEKFASLSRLLSYLKACARSCVRDEYRKMRHIAENARPDQAYRVEKQQSNHPTLSNVVATKQEVAAIRDRVKLLLKNDHERVVFQEFFEWDLRPIQIYERHTTLFQSALEVSRIKRNLLERLGRDPILKTLWREYDHQDDT